VLFYLGTHRPNWLELTDVPLMVSNRTLATRKTLPRARGRVVIDCGGFSELVLYSEWRTAGKQYGVLGRRYVQEIGNVDWLAAQDLMCEPFMLEKTGLTVRTHQAMTVAGYLELLDRAPDLPWLPVLQGWTPADYFRHVDQYAAAGVDLASLPCVGIGSTCKRQALFETRYTVRRLAAAGIRLHGFGVKTAGLAGLSDSLVSSDSMAWSFQGRREQRCLPGHTEHKNGANCLDWALTWREYVVGKLAPMGPLFDQCEEEGASA
jgi:hypothetical protein